MPLFIELILITYAAWLVVDNVAVIAYDRNVPSGIDTERLCYIKIGQLDKQYSGYDTSRDSDEARFEDYRRMLDRVKELPEVENATFSIESQGIGLSGNCINSLTNDRDTVYIPVCGFVPGYNFFETYGIKAGTPSKPIEELSAESRTDNNVILTQWLADRMLQGDSLSKRVSGVVGNVKIFQAIRSFNIMFIPYPGKGYNMSIIVRLRPDVNAKDFAYNHRDYVSKSLRSGNLYGQSITDYETLTETHHYMRQSNNLFNLCLIMLIFFLSCLFLGVIGTYYLQTRQRSNEAGIMKSYGASAGYIVRMMVGEGVTLTVTGWIIGSLLFLYFPLSGGLSTGSNPLGGTVFQPTWVDNYPLHAAIIALLVLVTMIIPTVIGVIIPAYKVSHVNPVDALRDE